MPRKQHLARIGATSIWARTKVVAAVMAAAMIGLLAAPATPASAWIGEGFVQGAGVWQNDWNDEGPISSSSYRHNNVVAMWQQILWADGYLTWSDIDCDFGPLTTAATKLWQNQYGVGQSGAADNATFEKAATRLRAADSDSFYYPGAVIGRFIDFNRQSSGIWNMYIAGDLHNLAYTYTNFEVCL